MGLHGDLWRGRTGIEGDFLGRMYRDGKGLYKGVVEGYIRIM